MMQYPPESKLKQTRNIFFSIYWELPLYTRDWCSDAVTTEPKQTLLKCQQAVQLTESEL